MSKLIYAVVYNNGQVDAWSTNQGPPAMPYVPELEVQSEIDCLKEENVRYRKALEEIIARGTDYDSTMNELVYIAREALEVQG